MKASTEMIGKRTRHHDSLRIAQTLAGQRSNQDGSAPSSSIWIGTLNGTQGNVNGVLSMDMRTLVVGLLLLSFHMDAAAQTKVVAVEGWNDPPSAEASAFLARTVRTFKARGFASAPRSGITLEEAQRLLAIGHTLFSENKQKQAAKVLGELVTQLREPPADPKEADELLAKQMPALVLLSQVNFRLKDKKGGVEHLEMVERQFPDKAIPYDDLGPESVERRPRIARQLAKRRKVSLTMRASPHGVIVLDGRKVGFDETTRRLHSGTYAAFARMGDAKSGVAWVTLAPGEKKDVRLVVPQGAELAKSIGASRLVLLSVWNNRLIKGALYVDGELVRQSKVRVGSDNERLKSFVDMLIQPEEWVPQKALTPSHLVDQESRPKNPWGDRLFLGSLGIMAAGLAVGAEGLRRDSDNVILGGSIAIMGGAAIALGGLAVSFDIFD